MTDVFLLWHIHGHDCDDHEFIGVYSDRALAVEAVARLTPMPGFREQPDLLEDPEPDEGGFEITRYRVNADHWSEGHILVGPPDQEPPDMSDLDNAGPGVKSSL
jgi:hypothetical protein